MYSKIVNKCQFGCKSKFKEVLWDTSIQFLKLVISNKE